MPGSGLPEGQYPSFGQLEDIFYKVDNHYVLLTKDFNAMSRDGFIYGAIINGYIRPLYNKYGEHIVVSQRNHEKLPIGKHDAENFNFDKHYSEVVPNIPLTPPTQVKKH